MRGILYGIGVGSGDPELLTIKAVRYIQEADIICLPRIPKEECRAYLIAKQAVPEIEDKECFCYDFKMIRDAEKLEKLHQEIYERIKDKISEGRKIAFLTIGDPLTYSTFSYILDKVKSDGTTVEIISGITSYNAIAARLRIALCEGDEELHIGTGTGDIKKLLALPGTKVIMKTGRKIKEVKFALEQIEQEEDVQVSAVTNCGLPDEAIYYGAAEIPLDDYMTTIVVKPGPKSGAR